MTLDPCSLVLDVCYPDHSHHVMRCRLFEGAASKRFGIDGDREAVPLMLEIVYNKVSFILS